MAIPFVSFLTHHFLNLDKYHRYELCRINKQRLSKRIGEPLAEIDPNGKKQKKRSAQTMWACAGCNPVKPCCKKTSCWEELHLGMED